MGLVPKFVADKRPRVLTRGLEALLAFVSFCGIAAATCNQVVGSLVSDGLVDMETKASELVTQVLITSSYL